MNTEFQILRWGIPGWIFLLTVITLKMSIHEFRIADIVALFNPSAFSGLAALFVASGIPIGFFIYQVYFFIKWFRGNNKIYNVVDKVSHFHDNNKYFLYMKRSKVNDDWKTIENYVDRIMTIEVPKRNLSSDDIARRYAWISHRTSRIHGLGASMWAILLGVIAFFIQSYELKEKFNFMTLETLAVYTVVWYIVFKNYSSANKNGFWQLNALVKDIVEAELKLE